MPRGDKYHVLVEGANHFSFDLQVRIAKNIASEANRGNKNSEEVNLFELDRNSRIRIYLQSASIAFWDAYLKLKKPGKEYLWSDALKIDSNGEVAILLK
jgi:hypothetical protein